MVGSKLKDNFYYHTMKENVYLYCWLNIGSTVHMIYFLRKENSLFDC